MVTRIKNRWFGCMAACCAVVTVAAADYYVAAGGTGDYSAGNPGPSPLAAAALATQAGDLVHVGPGLYTESATISLAQNTTMIGTTGNPEDVVITRTVSGNNDRVIYLGPNAVLRDITFRGGYTDYQAATVLGYSQASNVHKNFSVSNCIVENGSAFYEGGGSYGGTWRDCIIRNCQVRGKGVLNNGKTGSGGGIYGATLYNCVVTNNVGGYIGGGISGDKNDPTYAEGCLIGWNTGCYGGGAGANSNPAGTTAAHCRLVNCTIVSNLATHCEGYTFGGSGGGAFFAILTNCVVRGNRATFPEATGASGRGGGGLSTCTAYDCDIVENKAINLAGKDFHVCGGAADNGCILENCRIVGNEASGYAGATINCTNINCFVAGNWATTAGAALGGEFRDCVISNNWTTSGQGGAAYSSSTYNCLVIHNRSKLGAVLFQGYHEGDLIISNSVESVQAWSAGSAISPYNGGTTDGCDATAVNCTIVGNSGGDAALWAVHATNCLVVGNAPYDVMWMTLANTCMWVTEGNPNRPDETASPCVNGRKIADPKFVASPGKGECAYSLRLSSPCRDAGLYFDWMADAVDMLGNPRVKFDRVDIGAFECCAQYGATLVVR